MISTVGVPAPLPDVATLHIRNVPAEVVDVLKRRAAQSGHSLNTEVVQTLEEAAQRRSLEEIFESVRVGARHSGARREEREVAARIARIGVTVPA